MNLIKALIIVVAAGLASAADVRPAAAAAGSDTVISKPPSRIHISRPAYQDSTLQGGNGFAFPRVVVSFPDFCTANPDDAACKPPPNCETDPEMAGCDSGGTTNPPPPPPPPPPTCGAVCDGGWYDENGMCVASQPSCGGEAEGHCGVPSNWGPNADPDCIPVQGGWKCYRQGDGTIFYNCP